MNTSPFHKIFLRAWNSPTITTWLSYFTKSAGILFVLPVILNRFGAAEVSVWYLFTGIISLGGLADFGFRNTFIRLVAFAMGGATDIKVYNKKSEETDDASSGEINWSFIEKLYSMMTRIYAYISIVVLILLSVLGTLALLKPVSKVTDPNMAWVAWSLICITTTIEFAGKVYKNYLEGMYKVAMVKRYEAIFKTCSILTSLLVMIWVPSLLNLVIAHTTWTMINLIRDRYLARKVFDGKFKEFSRLPFEPELFKKVWKPAWRSGISSLMSNGLTNLTGLLYAQIGSSASLASYLLALKIITGIRDISNAPFYSKIPLLGRLRSTGELAKLTKISVKGMSLAYMVFFVGVLFVGLFSDLAMNLINSQTEFLNTDLWWLLAIAFFVHRVGSLQMQLYLTTNHVISHIVDGLSGVIFIGVSFTLLGDHGLYAFPIGMIAGYFGVHVWISNVYSFKSLDLSYWSFHKKFVNIPMVILLCLVALLIISVQ